MSQLTPSSVAAAGVAAPDVAAGGDAPAGVPTEAFRVAPFFAALGLLAVCALVATAMWPLCRQRIAQSRVLRQFAARRGISTDADPRIGHAVLADIEDTPIIAGSAATGDAALSLGVEPANYSTFRLDVEEETMLSQWRAARAQWQHSMTSLRT